MIVLAIFLFFVGGRDTQKTQNGIETRCW